MERAVSARSQDEGMCQIKDEGCLRLQNHKMKGVVRL